MRDCRLVVRPALILAVFAMPGCAAFGGGSVESSKAARTARSAASVKRNYDKREYLISMRDGVKLFTAVYTPKNTSEETGDKTNEPPDQEGS